MNKYFKTFEGFFNPRQSKNLRKKKSLKPIKNLEESEREEEERSNQIQEIGKRATISHDISNKMP